MMDQYRLYKRKRGGCFYAQCNFSRKQESLGTKDRKEAKRLLDAKNEASRQPAISIAVARAYLSVHDRQLIERTWADVIQHFCSRGDKQSSRDRKERACKGKAFDRIRNKRLLETTAEDFLAVLAGKGAMVSQYLKCVHNLALGLNWLLQPVLGAKQWPSIEKQKKRAITREEHQKIIAAEGNVERRSYYEMLWHTGAAQTDAAEFSNANVDWSRRTLGYVRRKTGEHATLQIGHQMESLLKQLPQDGPFFPRICRTTVGARAAEFCRRLKLVGITGVSLHSYRYAWAQRAKACGYSQRWAEAALGHNSPAVHNAYANGGFVECPPLDDYEEHHTSKTCPS
jgi:integrase